MRARTLGSARMPSMPRPPCCNSASTPPLPPAPPPRADARTCALTVCPTRTRARTHAQMPAHVRRDFLPRNGDHVARAHAWLVPSAVCTHRRDSLASTGPHLRRDRPTSAPGSAHICAGTRSRAPCSDAPPFGGSQGTRLADPATSCTTSSIPRTSIRTSAYTRPPARERPRAFVQSLNCTLVTMALS
jgi:hypothetical protein